MKNVLASIKEKMIQRYTIEDENLYSKKSTNINILLNRVKSNEKLELRKKIYLVLICLIGVLSFAYISFE